MRIHELTENLASTILKGAVRKLQPAARTVAQSSSTVQQFPVANILNAKGGIGTQGVSPYQMADLFNNVLRVKTPPNATMDQLITMLKNNPAAQTRLREFTAKNPIQIHSFPDNYYEVADGNHRAYLLYKLGDKTIPAVIAP